MRALVLTLLLAVSSCSAPPESAKAAPSQAVSENAPAIPVQVSYRVQQQGGGLGVFVDEAAVFYEVGDPPNRVWVLERRRRDQRMGETAFRADWIDGRACPALEAAIAKLGRLPPIGMAGLDTRSGVMISDTPEVTLMGPAAPKDGGFIMRRDTQGPVSHWWWETSKALEGCSRPKQPYIAGAYDLRSRLGSAEDEVKVMSPKAR
jgi:hypothetical protein